jgi:hypothetical protein
MHAAIQNDRAHAWQLGRTVLEFVQTERSELAQQPANITRVQEQYYLKIKKLLTPILAGDSPNYPQDMQQLNQLLEVAHGKLNDRFGQKALEHAVRRFQMGVPMDQLFQRAAERPIERLSELHLQNRGAILTLAPEESKIRIAADVGIGKGAALQEHPHRLDDAKVREMAMQYQMSINPEALLSASRPNGHTAPTPLDGTGASHHATASQAQSMLEGMMVALFKATDKETAEEIIRNVMKDSQLQMTDQAQISDAVAAQKNLAQDGSSPEAL